MAPLGWKYLFQGGISEHSCVWMDFQSNGNDAASLQWERSKKSCLIWVEAFTDSFFFVDDAPGHSVFDT